MSRATCQEKKSSEVLIRKYIRQLVPGLIFVALAYWTKKLTTTLAPRCVRCSAGEDTKITKEKHLSTEHP